VLEGVGRGIALGRDRRGDHLRRRGLRLGHRGLGHRLGCGGRFLDHRRGRRRLRRGGSRRRLRGHGSRLGGRRPDGRRRRLLGAVHGFGDVRRRLGLLDWGRLRRKERQRVDVALRIGGHADAQMDVRLRGHGIRALADPRHHGSLVDERAFHHEDLPELEQRDREAVGGLDRHRLPAPGNEAGERDGSRRGGADVGAELAAHVDAAVLAARVRIVS